MKYHKYTESEELHEIGEVLRYAKDRIVGSKTDWQSNLQFPQINAY